MMTTMWKQFARQRVQAPMYWRQGTKAATTMTSPAIAKMRKQIHARCIQAIQVSATPMSVGEHLYLPSSKASAAAPEWIMNIMHITAQYAKAKNAEKQMAPFFALEALFCFSSSIS